MRQHRIDGSEDINPVSIAKHIDAGERVIVQFSKGCYSAQQLTLLNQLAKNHGRSFEIRFYGHYSEVFDASVLQWIPDAQCVSIDCLMKASNLEALSKIQTLVELSLGVFDLERIHTTGHTRHISTICSLPLLRDLSLSSIKKNDDIEFVSSIPTLKTLRLILGGRASIAQLASTQLESLEISRVQGLEDIGDLGRFENLERMLIRDQIRLANIKVGPNSRLIDMNIVNCKTLETIAGIGELKALSSLQVYKTAIDYEKLVTGSMPSSLKAFAFYTGKSKRDAEIRMDLEKRGFHEHTPQ
jgi:hypothetical protein